jgi:hypothetical protein
MRPPRFKAGGPEGENMKIIPITAVALSFVTGTCPALLASQGRAGAGSAASSVEAEGESPFACNITALTPEERARHFNELGPELRSLKQGVRELADGYEFRFPSDARTYRLLTEWTAGERVCCPFFDVDVRSTREGGPLWLRLTGREGVKSFIEVEGAAWLKKRE